MRRRSIGLALCAGVLFGAGFPPIDWPLFLPIAVALLISSLDCASTVRQASYSGLFAGLMLYAMTLPWLFRLFGPTAISLLFIAAAFPMLFGGLYFWLAGRLQARYPSVPSWALAAALWTGIEYYRSELFWLNFGWMGLGYGPIEHGIFSAVASITGSYGISFVIVAMGAALSTTRASASAAGPVRHILRAALIVFWLLLFLLPLPTPQPNNPMSVRLVQSRGGEAEEAVKLSNPPEAGPVDVILWPEYSVMDDPRHDIRLWKSIQELARKNNAVVIFGGKEHIGNSGDRYHNTAFVVDATGQLIGTHYKNHPVHFFQDGVKGTDAKPIRTPLGLLGVAICFDMDYPDVARKLVQRGAEVLLVPNMDPDEWGDLQRHQHRLMFQMRAAECGRWLARADVAGGTSVAAPNGQEVEQIGTPQPRSMDVIIGREQGKTLYVRGGWLFGPACFWLTATLTAMEALRAAARRKHIANEQAEGACHKT